MTFSCFYNPLNNFHTHENAHRHSRSFCAKSDLFMNDDDGNFFMIDAEKRKKLIIFAF